VPGEGWGKAQAEPGQTVVLTHVGGGIQVPLAEQVTSDLAN